MTSTIRDAIQADVNGHIVNNATAWLASSLTPPPRVARRTRTNAPCHSAGPRPSGSSRDLCHRLTGLRSDEDLDIVASIGGASHEGDHVPRSGGSGVGEVKAMVNRTQALVLGFALLAWVSLLVILWLAPEVYEQAVKLPASHRRPTVLAFLVVLSCFIGLLAVGVVRRWRWTFWLVLVAFLAGVLRVPVAALQLTGLLAADGPAWYVLFQGVVGVVQFAIGLAMLIGYRRAGVWGHHG
jgi:hypothetical protein